MTHHLKYYSASMTCGCGKEYSGNPKQVDKLQTLHQKFCKFKKTEQYYQEFLINHSNPLSGNGEKEKQKALSTKQLAPIMQFNK